MPSDRPSRPPFGGYPLTSKRLVPPPLRATVSYPSEPPTITKNESIVLYQSLLMLFDSMSIGERLEFIELATAFRDLSSADRELLVTAASELARIER